MGGLEELFAAGKQAWPQIDVGADVFRARASATENEGLRAADLYLAIACAEGNPTAIAEFERLYLSRVPQHLARLRKSPTFVEEATQRLREKLFVGSAKAPPRIASYSGRGSLDSWLSVMATRLAFDLDDAERRHTVAHDPPDDDALGTTADPELAYIRQRYLPQFKQAFAAAMRQLTAEERNLLRFYLVDGLNIAQIGSMLGKSRATIGRWLIECRGKILEATKQALAKELGSATELTSLLRFLHTQLEVSVQNYLVVR